MIRQAHPPPPIVMEIVTDPDEIARAKIQDEQASRNLAWMQTQSVEFWDQHRGKCVCVAGQEAFVADDSREAVALARAAHPDDDGYFVKYIPIKKVARIYAHTR